MNDIRERNNYNFLDVINKKKLIINKSLKIE